MCLLQDELGSGFPGTVPTPGVHPDHQRLLLLGAAAHPVLQRGAVLEGMEGNHAVIVICCQQQDGWIGATRVRWLRQIVERRIPGKGSGENVGTFP